MITGKRAIVVPRVRSPECGYAFALEETIEPHLGSCGIIAVHGPYGSGKTTALRHLAAVLQGRLVVFDDETPREEIEAAAMDRLTVYGRTQPHRLDHLETFLLAPWGLDEVLEYLMAVHPQRCGAVMAKLPQDHPETPELWTALLDEMANATLDAREALAQVAYRVEVGERLWRYPVVRSLRDARNVARAVLAEKPTILPGPDRSMIAEAARLLERTERARDALCALWQGEVELNQPGAASLLLALDPDWKPDTAAGAHLNGALLAGAHWRGVDLTDAELAGADLSRADLESACLSDVEARGALLGRAILRKTHLDRADLCAADLHGADLTGASLPKCYLLRADLTEARLVRADLASAVLTGARIRGADFSRANLSGARLRRLDLRRSTWTGARFEGAHLEQCHLEGMRLPGAIFSHAHLDDTHLTATDMPGAHFAGADLRGAKLAEISWERADLRDADL
ncbi:MAG: pentapeptide repeat-containing protein, partial [Planctomycetota bacterium]